MKKVKHDKELEKLAKKLVAMPFNKNSSNKTWINNVLHKNWYYFENVRRNNNVTKIQHKNI